MTFYTPPPRPEYSDRDIMKLPDGDIITRLGYNHPIVQQLRGGFRRGRGGRAPPLKLEKLCYLHT